MMIYLSLFLVSLLAGLLVFFQKKFIKYLNGLLAFSGAYLLGVSFLHLLPELFEGDTSNIGLFLLVGFFSTTCSRLL